MYPSKGTRYSKGTVLARYRNVNCQLCWECCLDGFEEERQQDRLGGMKLVVGALMQGARGMLVKRGMFS